MQLIAHGRNCTSNNSTVKTVDTGLTAQPLQEFYPESSRESGQEWSYYLMRLSTIWGEDFLDFSEEKEQD